MEGISIMQKLGLNEIREKYLSFFETKGHLRMDSAPLIPKNDASLLLINSGMAPLKPFFKGEQIPPRERVTTCQKCIRTPDIENVGKTARHGTFFEMLGNFSFGNYFKHEAIAWAWEFITEVMRIPKDVLWVTVYEEDDEARDIWINEVGVDPERVVKMGKADNFWEHGTGPCGPCSEIHIDRGADKGCGKPDCKIGCDCDRFMEIWNLVFTQFDKDEAGNYNKLPKPNIDTGMGLERLAVIMQGVDNLFEVDTVKNVMAAISEIAGVHYKENEKTDISLRVITDHIRSTVMMVSDGVIPSNEGRGYVLRRLLRRAARHGKLLGINRQFLYEVADTVINESKSAYPELEEKRDYIKKIIKIEEQNFDKTIDNGLSILNEYIAELKAENKTVLDGKKTFKLYDTYGFPIDLTVEILSEQNMTVDEDGFKEQMNIQRTTARNSRKDGSSWDSDEIGMIIKNYETKFVGYTNLEYNSEITALIAGGSECKVLSEGDDGMIITAETPFYGEGGGQIGDMGTIETDMGRSDVVDTKKFADGRVYVHHIKVTGGEFKVGDKVTLKVDRERRLAISRNHSSTHLMHKALKEVLGSHVGQAGSYVSDERLRFDFSHFEAMTQEEIDKVEEKVNKAILAGMDIKTREMPIEEAKKLGATAQFGEKYGSVVRVVSMGDYSMEFCGGCHLTNTSQAGLFKILSESGVAAGTRRIEAVTGVGVLKYIAEKDAVIERTAEVLKTKVNEIDKKAESLVNELKETKKALESAKAKMANSQAGDVMSNMRTVKGVNIVTAQFDGLGNADLRRMGDSIKDKLGCGALVISGNNEGKIAFIAMVTKDAVEKGVHAGKIIKEVTAAAGGSGGGKPDMAQGGGKDASKVADALAKVDEIVELQVRE